MKSIKLLINKNGFEILKILLEEFYLTESVANNMSDVDEVNIAKKPSIIKRVNELIYYVRNNLKDYDIKLFEITLKELQSKKNINFCYILEDDNNILTILENKIPVDRITEI